MNIKDLHQNAKAVSTAPLFKAGACTVTSLRILENEKLKEHTTPVPALLICVLGEVVFENAHGLKLTLTPGDYVNIEPAVTHWVTATHTSNLVLIR